MNIERPKSNQQMPEDAKLVFKGEVFDVYQWEQETKPMFIEAKYNPVKMAELRRLFDPNV